MSLQDWAPKLARGRKIPHDFHIIDQNDPVPAFLLRQDRDTASLRTIERAVSSDLQDVIHDPIVEIVAEEPYMQQSDDDPPPEMEPPIEAIKLLIRKLSYRELKTIAGEIIGDKPPTTPIEMADALDAWAAQEDTPEEPR
jgi:hypothetical protein